MRKVMLFDSSPAIFRALSDSCRTVANKFSILFSNGHTKQMFIYIFSYGCPNFCSTPIRLPKVCLPCLSYDRNKCVGVQKVG